MHMHTYTQHTYTHIHSAHIHSTHTYTAHTHTLTHTHTHAHTDTHTHSVTHQGGQLLGVCEDVLAGDDEVILEVAHRVILPACNWADSHHHLTHKQHCASTQSDK